MDCRLPMDHSGTITNDTEAFYGAPFVMLRTIFRMFRSEPPQIENYVCV
jgi:hypothetical protein